MRKLVTIRRTVFGQGLFRRLTQPSAQHRDDTKTRALYAELHQQHARSPFTAPLLIDRMATAILQRAVAQRRMPPMLATSLAIAARELVACEAHLFSLPVLTHHASIAQAVAARAQLRQRLAFFDNHEQLVTEWLDGLVDLLSAVVSRIPHLPDQRDASLLLPVPIITFINEPARLVTELVSIALRFATDPHLDRNSTRPGARLADLITANLLRTSRISYADAQKRPERLSSPLTDNADAKTLLDRYLTATPLATLVMAPVPLAITQATRFEHEHILAGTGFGKTQTIQNRVISDLQRPPAQVPAMVVIDSKGAMLEKIARLACFDPDRGKLANRLIIIDPTDIDHPPGLNIFDLNTARIATYGRAAQEQILNSVIELYDYIFTALLDADMTQRQRLVFRYAARLMLAIHAPTPTIHTLRELLDPQTGNDLYQAHADKLTVPVRAFFESEFLDKQYIGTRRQVLRRLYGILENPTLERMLAADKNRVDLFASLNAGAIVLVSTARDFLNAERSSFFGRIFIALTLQAVFERAALPEHKRRPTFLVIDEASEYFDKDSRIDDLLSQARQYKCGVLLAHQYLDQLKSGALKASIAANCSIKMAAGLADEDARVLAPNMRCKPEFIAQQTKTDRAATFAIYVRNLTPTAVTLTVPFGVLEAQPKMSHQAYARLIASNRARLSSPTTPPPHHDPLPQPPANPPRGKLRAGAQEHIYLPEHNLTLTAKLDTQAIGLCALHVLTLERFDTNGIPYARFMLAAHGGARVTLERKILDTVAVDPFGGPSVKCPVVALRFNIAHHELTQRFALAINATSEVLLGQPVLAGRFIVDSEETFLLDRPQPHGENPASDDDWRS